MVVTLTGTGADGEAEGSAGTVTTQDVWLGQLTRACVPPNVTVITPLLLKNPDPDRFTVCPAAPAAGVMAATAGLPFAAAVVVVDAGGVVDEDAGGVAVLEGDAAPEGLVAAEPPVPGLV